MQTQEGSEVDKNWGLSPGYKTRAGTDLGKKGNLLFDKSKHAGIVWPWTYDVSIAQFFPSNFILRFFWVTPFSGKKSPHGAKRAAEAPASGSHNLKIWGKTLAAPGAQIESQLSSGSKRGQIPIPESIPWSREARPRPCDAPFKPGLGQLHPNYMIHRKGV